MRTILKITAAMTGAKGFSAQLADEFIQQWLADNPGSRIVERDLYANPVPHLTAERFEAFSTPATELSSGQRTVVAYSDELIAELQAADVIVFAVPMYNFSVPSTLRAYFDHIARAGVTFRYTAEGAKGMIVGKQAYVFVARGGIYPAAADTQTPYLRQFLRFIGITDVEFIYAEGLGMGDEARNKGLASARDALAQLVAAPRAAA
jgi:FMN-dependent NADH-azoreductase